MIEGKGWECPKCGAVYAPWKAKCDTCIGASTVQWIPTPIVVQECEHVWGEPGQSTIGVTCEKCGQLQNGPQPFTITSTEERWHKADIEHDVDRQGMRDGGNNGND